MLRVLASFAVVVGVFTITPVVYAKSSWVSDLDFEPSLRLAALVIAVRVDDVSQVRLVYGGKGSTTLSQYTFKPIRVWFG